MPDLVMELAERHGHDRVCGLFDQNLTNYHEGAVFGTGLCRELRQRGFCGCLVIQSANDEASTQGLEPWTSCASCVQAPCDSSVQQLRALLLFACSDYSTCFRAGVWEDLRRARVPRRRCQRLPWQGAQRWARGAYPSPRCAMGKGRVHAANCFANVYIEDLPRPRAVCTDIAKPPLM